MDLYVKHYVTFCIIHISYCPWFMPIQIKVWKFYDLQAVQLAKLQPRGHRDNQVIHISYCPQFILSICRIVEALPQHQQDVLRRDRKLERSRAVLPPLSFSYQPLVTYFKCCQSKEKAEHSIELGGATFWGVLVFDPYANFTEV